MDIPGIRNHLEMNKGAFTILSTNITCLNAKFDELSIFIQDLKQNGLFFSAICLQESWLSEDDDIFMYQLDGYTCSPKGGLVIYLHENFTYSTVALYERSDVWEGQFIQISGNELSFKLLLGNVYRPPRDILHNYNTFNDEFNHVLEQLTRSKPEVIIAGDYNINLLELAKRNIVNKYFTFITSYNCYPHITLPTRFSRSNATLIDNFLCKSSEVLSSATSGILIDKFSDHQPYFICLKNKKKYNKPRKYITINKQNTENIHKFVTELASANLLDSLDHDLDADPETNYNIFEAIIDNHRTKCFPNKIIKFNKLKHKQNNWISIGILKSIKFRNDLYRRMRISPPDGEAHNIIAVNLHTYNKILRRTIRLAKRNYYHNLFKKSSNNIKQTWTEINIMLNKAKNKVKIPDYFLIGRKEDI